MARTKYTERFCGYCNKSMRMEIVGEMEGKQDRRWFRCTRCHHMTLVDLSAELMSQNQLKPDGTSATMYSPELTFKIGESIFHSEWNDTGKVVNKIKTSDGSQSIVVSFEKQGQRRLIENLKPEPAPLDLVGRN